MSIDIVVFITPAEHFSEEFSGLILDLKKDTLLEAGCFQFDVFKHNKDYVLIEKWQDQAAIDFHMQKSYTSIFKEKINGKIINTTVNRLESLTV